MDADCSHERNLNFSNSLHVCCFFGVNVDTMKNDLFLVAEYEMVLILLFVIFYHLPMLCPKKKKSPFLCRLVFRNKVMLTLLTCEYMWLIIVSLCRCEEAA